MIGSDSPSEEVVSEVDESEAGRRIFNFNFQSSFFVLDHSAQKQNHFNTVLFKTQKILCPYELVEDDPGQGRVDGGR